MIIREYRDSREDPESFFRSPEVERIRMDKRLEAGTTLSLVFAASRYRSCANQEEFPVDTLMDGVFDHLPDNIGHPSVFIESQLLQLFVKSPVDVDIKSNLACPNFFIHSGGGGKNRSFRRGHYSHETPPQRFLGRSASVQSLTLYLEKNRTQSG